MSIDAGAYVAIILLACGPCEVIVNCLGQVLYLGRAPRTKETLPDFREWCRVTRHSRVFRGLTGGQRTPGFWGVTYTSTEHSEPPSDIKIHHPIAFYRGYKPMGNSKSRTKRVTKNRKLPGNVQVGTHKH